MSEKNYLLLKWGTLKGWNMPEDGECFELLKKYFADGVPMSAMADRPEEDRKEILRQLYYQFVARDLIPNKQTEYKRLGSVINDARLAGLIDWTAIEDRTRNLRKVSTWDTPNDILRSAASSFKLDLWENQDNYC